jgi:ABC-type multidrug transport system ATPase subunit
MDPAMTGGELFNWFARLRSGVDRPRIKELTEQLQLDPTRPYGAPSKGNRQKVGIIQAFMHDPEVLLLDEPTTGLDVVITLDGPVGPAIRVAASNGEVLRVSPASDELEDLFIKLYDESTEGRHA